MTGGTGSGRAAVSVTGVGRALTGGAGVRGSAGGTGILNAAVRAVRAALVDAGVAGPAVDGVLACGAAGADIADALGLELKWRTQESDRTSIGAALVQAVDAVAAGRVGHLVCVEASAGSPTRLVTPARIGAVTPVAGWPGWHAPYGADSALVAAALAARAYTERYGLTRTELAQVALVASANVGRSLRLRDYLAAPMIADPLCVHDRAETIRGAAAAAIVLSGAAAVREPVSRAVAVAGSGAAYGVSPLAEQESARPVGVVERAAAALWSRADSGVRDVGVVMLGDEFSFAVLPWLEALGFCAVGAAGSFVATGRRIARGGDLPLNPHGGHLGLGKRPDLDLVVAAVAQVRGDAGPVQVLGPPGVAVVGLGGASAAGCLLLR
ncbi:hypothetical protein GCM10023094_42000 [Rhodococcus olei]|uniref:Thiolase C-terminal domain-containing protein n=1 Tax=Rhodococcus olei TaxID=2161675 RepID=A0ABP8PGB6_9NOCA